MTLHTFVILPLSFVVLWFVARNRKEKLDKTFLQLFILNLLLSIWYAFWFYKGWEPLKEKYQLLIRSTLLDFTFTPAHYLFDVCRWQLCFMEKEQGVEKVCVGMFDFTAACVIYSKS